MRALKLLSLLLVAFAAGCSSWSEAQSDAADEANVTGTLVLLECNVFESGHGPDRRVTVFTRGGGLVLEELTTAGDVVERALDRAEWEREDIKLRTEPLDPPEQVNRLYKKDGAWLEESVGGDWTTRDHAYCYKDTTQR